jgi:hypothetical protein
MEKFTEMVTATMAMINTAVSSGMSSSALVDMQRCKKAVFTVVASRPLTYTSQVDAFTVSSYESTASTWNGAVATVMTGTVSVVTGSISSAGVLLRMEINDYDLMEGRRYAGFYIANNTNTNVCAIIEQSRGDNEPL